MSLRTCLVALVVSLFTLQYSVADELPDTSGMNILFINIEDCAAQAWGCYGNSICQTPNIDRFAKSAVRFDRAYCQGVCCNPSRISFLTGLRPSTTGIFFNEQAPMEFLSSDTLTLPEYAKRHRLYTANVSKLFHGKHETPQWFAFDRLEMVQRPEGWQGPEPILDFPPVPEKFRYGPPPTDDTDSALYRAWRRERSNRWGVSGLTDEQEHDGRVARTASALLKEFAGSGDQFFLSVGSSRPHTPLLSPEKYHALYDPEKIPWPKAPPEDDQNIPDVARNFGRTNDIYPERDQAREVIAAYYACVTFLDAQLGIVLDTLDETGLADNTIVIFFADHGFQLGEHALWSKYSLFEGTCRVPLLVRVPGAPANGQTCSELVELVDLLPTIGQLTQMTLPENLDGTSFVPLLINPDQPWKRATFTEWDEEGKGKGMRRTLRTKDFRYCERLFQGEKVIELYDHRTDPWETINRAGDPNYARHQSELAALMKAGWRGALPDR